MSVIKNNKNYGTRVVVEEIQPSHFSDYLTVTYVVPEANANFAIVQNTENIAGWRIKGATTWETPTTTINVTSANVPTLTVEFDLIDNTKVSTMQFFGIVNVSKVELPATITTLEYGCFFNCRCMTELPNLQNITSIDDIVFYSNNIKLNKYVINDNVTRNYNHGAFSNNFTASEYMYINGAIYNYMDGSYEDAVSAWNHPLDLSNGVDGLTITKWFLLYQYKTFNGVKIPSTVTYLKENAFIGCDLGDVYMYPTVPPTKVGSEQEFNNCTITNFYVPQGSLAAYQTAYPDYASVMSEM